MSGFLLDTNVVSELRKGAKANSNVLTWARAVDQRQLFISVLVFGEIRKGLETLRRKDPVQAQALEKWLEGLRSMFSERNLPITDQIADIWGRNSADMPSPVIDSLLAATAIEHNLTLVTRNIQHVQKSGAKVFNPF